MRVLFTSLPAVGHFNSIMPLARATADAGHDVAICCARAFADEVTRTGLQYLRGGAESPDALSAGAPPMGSPERPPAGAAADRARAVELLEQLSRDRGPILR
jgi:hypothetical protein